LAILTVKSLVPSPRRRRRAHRTLRSSAGVTTRLPKRYSSPQATLVVVHRSSDSRRTRCCGALYPSWRPVALAWSQPGHRSGWPAGTLTTVVGRTGTLFRRHRCVFRRGGWPRRLHAGRPFPVPRHQHRVQYVYCPHHSVVPVPSCVLWHSSSPGAGFASASVPTGPGSPSPMTVYRISTVLAGWPDTTPSARVGPSPIAQHPGWTRWRSAVER